ncbi:MAG: EVE domain-containing protein [Deltaproteobacteria bacterium]|nr:EVE domain-containing protein [Deltaproteobacteria bacterium]MBN2672742.1 EVE domain-containing protein [Deltaproteobacteria bacterium]
MNYFLVKTEPGVFSIDDLQRVKREPWDGVRNYQARNIMRDDMKIGDKVLFYHSNATPPGVAGICKVVSKPYPDASQFDPNSKYFDPKSSPDNPKWVLVDMAFVQKFTRLISLEELKSHPELFEMRLLQHGNRLSVMPVKKAEFDFIVKLSKLNQ